MNYALENHIEEIIETEGYKFPVLARENKSSAKGFYDTRRFPVHQFLAIVSCNPLYALLVPPLRAFPRAPNNSCISSDVKSAHGNNFGTSESP